MVLWRISRHRDLSGSGGLKAPGRWHHAGQPIVYLAGSPASALLEVCAHTSANDVPPEFTLLKIEGPAAKIRAVKAEGLAADWKTRIEVTRDLGMEWIRKKQGVLLRVPSALVPETANFLFNPMHADSARYGITGVFEYPFDVRLKM